MRILTIVALAASVHAAAAFLPSSVHSLRSAGAVRAGRNGLSSRSPIFMSATAAPKERTVRAPVFSEICSETGVTLSRYMMELSRENPELRDLESLIGGIQQVHRKLRFVHQESLLNEIFMNRLARPSRIWLIAHQSLV